MRGAAICRRRRAPGSAYAFANLRLHRIEAACLPTNQRSIRLLEGAGFRREGLARAYLRINGVWQDHLLYGLLESDPLPLRARKPNATSRA